MKRWEAFLDGFLKGDEGATATEYAVMLALVLAVVILTVAFLGLQVEGGFNGFATLFQSVTN